VARRSPAISLGLMKSYGLMINGRANMTTADQMPDPGPRTTDPDKSTMAV
jgi:hypothetical protein